MHIERQGGGPELHIGSPEGTDAGVRFSVGGDQFASLVGSREKDKMIFARRQEFYGDNEITFTIDVADKNVGVGTLDPQAALHIRKDIGAEVILDTINNANVGAGIHFARQGTQFGYILGARGSGQHYVGIGYMADAYGRNGGNKNILTVDTKNQSVVISGRDGTNNTLPSKDPFYGDLYTLDVDGKAKVQSLDIGGGGSRKTEWKVQGTEHGYAIMNTDRKVYDYVDKR